MGFVMVVFGRSGSPSNEGSPGGVHLSVGRGASQPDHLTVGVLRGAKVWLGVGAVLAVRIDLQLVEEGDQALGGVERRLRRFFHPVAGLAVVQG